MSQDPVRWKDAEDAPAKVRGLLVHGRAIAPMPADVRAGLLAQLPEGAAPHAPASSPAPSPAPAGGLGVPGAWLGGALVVVVVAAGALVWSARTPENPHAPLAPRPSGAPSASEALPAAPPASLADTEEASAVPRTPVRSPRPMPAATSFPPRALVKPAPSGGSPPAGSSLAEESALIGRVRTSLAPSPALALTAIDEHARRFPHGELAAEREYLRVSALRRLGRAEEARSRGKSYLAAYASSPYAPSVRTILAELGEP